MNELAVVFVWGLAVGAIVALFVGFYAGRTYQLRASSRSEYAKMKREFEEKRKVVEDSIDAARKRSVFR